MTTGGQLVVLKIAGIETDPIGDFTLRENGIKREVSEVTRKGTKLTETAIAGKIAGQVSNRDDLDISTIRNSKNVPVSAEEPNGKLWSGTMSYTADADVGVNDGQFQINLEGDLKRLP